MDPVQQWLLNACGVVESPGELVDLTALGPRVADELLGVFETGPNSDLIAEVEETANEWYARRRTLLERGTGLGLSEAQLELARKVNQEQYVAQARADFVHRYRAEALRGLAAVGGPRAQSLLTSIAADTNSPFQATARASVRRLRAP